MAPLKMLGCTVAIGGTAAGLQVARCTRYRPGLCPPGALPAPGLPARTGRASTPPRARGQGHPVPGPDLHPAPSTGTFFYAIIDDLLKPKRA